MLSMSPAGRIARDRGLVYGAMASRSSEKPNTDPCFSTTPMTSYGTPFSRSSRPIGSSALKKCSATSTPITMTREPAATSCGPKARPRSTLNFLIVK